MEIDDAVAQAKLQALARLIPQKMREAASRALHEESALLTPLVRAHVAQRMNVQRRSFLGAVKAKVYDKKPDRLPVLWVGSKVEWLGAHERGVTINGKMLIPIGQRLSKKRFRRIFSALRRTAFFVRKKNGQVVLMAPAIAENAPYLRTFKRAFRQVEGVKRITRDMFVPIAVLVPRVKLRKRLDIHGVVAQRVPAICARVLRTLKIA
ncbi:MAG: DUF6441 family protein [Thiomonas sp.]